MVKKALLSMAAINKKTIQKFQKQFEHKSPKKPSVRKIKVQMNHHRRFEDVSIPIESLLDAIPVAIYIKNTNTEKVYANQTEADRDGLKDPEVLIGKTDFDFFPYEMAAKYYADDMHVLQTGQPLTEIEEPVVRADGSTIWIRTTKTPLWDQDGNIIGLIGVNMNITDRKRAQDALMQYNQELKRWVDELERQKRISDLMIKIGYMLQCSSSLESICVSLSTNMEELFLDEPGKIFLFEEGSSRIFSTIEWGLPECKCNIADCEAQEKRKRPIENQSDSSAEEKKGKIQTINLPLRYQENILGFFHQHIPPEENGASEISAQLHIQQWEQVANTVAERIVLALTNIKLSEQLLAQSIRDPMTNLFNRRYMIETLERELHRAKRNKHLLWLLMMDMDHFKSINDTYGHVFGDHVLCTVSDFLQHNVRADDVVCRYGGEEFVIILIGLSHNDVLKRAEDLREGIADLKIHLSEKDNEEAISVTISMGVACSTLDAPDCQELILAADKALYLAKTTGRNRVVFHRSGQEEETPSPEIS